MSRIFFTGSALPPLEVGKELEWTFDDLLSFFMLNLSRRAMCQVECIRRYLDILNVRKLFRSQPLDGRAILSEKELDEALVNREGLPDFLYTYLDSYESVEEQEKHYSRVFLDFFHAMEKEAKGFLRFYFCFERQYRLILVGLRAKRLGLDLAYELQYEDSADPLVAQLLAQKELTQFEFPFEYRELGEKLSETKGDPLAEHRIVTQFRFNRIAEEVQDRPFSLDAILGYFAQFILIEDDNKLNDAEGAHRLDRIAKEIE